LLACALPREGLLLVLSGPLGTGKTLFAKGLAHHDANDEHHNRHADGNDVALAFT